MMMKSISGFTCYVKDLEVTASFYKKLGFDFVSQDGNSVIIRLNWFVITFVPELKETKEEFFTDAKAPEKGKGIYINVSVEDVDEFYLYAKKQGLQPSSEPRDWPWGNREFVLKDPDGYKLVFFKKLK